MKFLEKLSAKAADKTGKAPVTIAFLGDSVTQGCFEVYETGNGGLDTVYEPESGYPAKTVSILHQFCPGAQINTIPAGISGDSAPGGLARLERDVLRYSPDLTVVSFLLNDSCGGMERISVYTDALRQIFARLQDAGSEVIFMPSNPMCRSVSPHIRQELFRNLAPGFIRLMEDGVVDAYAEAGRKTAEECGVPVCDCYGSWNAMHQHGIDTTALLSNQLNHPTREMHWMFAWELIHTMLHT